MRFFSKEWINGEISDQEFAAMPATYAAHVESLHLPPKVLALAKANVHDGLLLHLHHDPAAARLMMRLRIGDLQKGYFDLDIEYSGASVDAESLRILGRAMNEPKDEFLYDEIDRESEQFVHRFLLASYAEPQVVFSSVSTKLKPVQSRSRI